MNKRTALLKSLTTHQSAKLVDGLTPQSIAIESPNRLEQNSLLALKTNGKSDVPNHWGSMLEIELKEAARALNMPESELHFWLETYPEVPHRTQLSMLRLIRRSELDPLLEELTFAKYDNGEWEAVITVNGWARLMNQNSVIGGISFAQSQERDDEVPCWMECTIYRTDRALPITVREYFAEVRGENMLWKKMPRRMLRHRTFQQCARLALGI
jgi:hypothetical protein